MMLFTVFKSIDDWLSVDYFNYTDIFFKFSILFTISDVSIIIIIQLSIHNLNHFISFFPTLNYSTSHLSLVLWMHPLLHSAIDSYLGVFFASSLKYTPYILVFPIFFRISMPNLPFLWETTQKIDPLRLSLSTLEIYYIRTLLLYI